MENSKANSSFSQNKKSDAGKKRVGAVVIGGNFQGLGVIRNLSRNKVPTYLIDKGMCIGKFSRYTDHFSKCPDPKQEEAFLEFLLDLTRREHLDKWLIYPNDDETVYFLAKNKEKLQQYYTVTTESWDIIKFAYDKMLTYQIAEKCGVAVPKTYYPKSVEEVEKLDVKYPVILKPSIREPFFSRTGKKALRIDDKNQLIEEYSKAITAIGAGQIIMVQELIPGRAQNLFGVGSLANNGELLASVVVRRPRQHPMDFGHATTFAETVDIPELQEMARKILAAMNFHGLSEVEFMLDSRDNIYKLIEVNARPWGWHSIAIEAGVDLPYLSYLDMLGEKVKKDGFIKGVKWFRLVTDIPTAFIELIMGRMKFSEYYQSLKGKKQDAVLMFKDPVPFFIEILMLPYLWSKKGFW